MIPAACDATRGLCKAVAVSCVPSGRTAAFSSARGGRGATDQVPEGGVRSGVAAGAAAVSRPSALASVPSQPSVKNRRSRWAPEKILALLLLFNTTCMVPGPPSTRSLARSGARRRSPRDLRDRVGERLVPPAAMATVHLILNACIAIGSRIVSMI